MDVSENHGMLAALLGLCSKVIFDSRKNAESAVLVKNNLKRIEEQMKRMEDKESESIKAFTLALNNQADAMRDLGLKLSLQDHNLKRIGDSVDKIVEKVYAYHL